MDGIRFANYVREGLLTERHFGGKRRAHRSPIVRTQNAYFLEWLDVCL
jgi:hypothetical protein